MKAVWKFELLSGSIEIPRGSGLLACQFQGSKICAWFIVDPSENRRVSVEYLIVGTGRDFDPGTMAHWGTLQDRQGFVWHVFGKTKGKLAL